MLSVKFSIFPKKSQSYFWADRYFGAHSRHRERAHYHLSIQYGSDPDDCLIVDPYSLSGKVNHAGSLACDDSVEKSEKETPDPRQNLLWVDLLYKGIPYIGEVAFRNISKGDELLTSYGDAYNLDPFHKDHEHPRKFKEKALRILRKFKGGLRREDAIEIECTAIMCVLYWYKFKFYSVRNWTVEILVWILTQKFDDWINIWFGVTLAIEHHLFKWPVCMK